jgi:hypothetical protein
MLFLTVSELGYNLLALKETPCFEYEWTAQSYSVESSPAINS